MSGPSAPARTATPGVRLLGLAAPLGTLALAAPIGTALAAGAGLLAEGGAILDLAWGVVTMVDLGLALVLGWAWIAWRTASVPRALVWALVVAVTGSAGICAYLAGAARRSTTVTEVLVGPHRAT